MALLEADLSKGELLVSLVCVFLTYLVTAAVYRVYFSPLAKFPGPKLAALTLWYEFYYDVVQRGKYTWKIEEMHKQYGPIVRISPFELHVNDPDYYDELYVAGGQRRTQKYQWAMKGFGPQLSSFATEDHDIHRIRRGAVAPFFSRASVSQLEPSVQDNINKLMSRLREFQKSGQPINLINVYIALTADIITNYAFASPFGFLDSPDFAPYWRSLMVDVSETSHLFKQFGFIEPMMRSFPESFAMKMNPKLTSLFALTAKVREKIQVVKADLAKGRKPEGQRTIFYDLLNNDELAPQDKEIERLENEGISLVAAGSNTVAHTVTCISFFVMSDQSMLDKLQKELQPVFAKDPEPKWSQLESLPYLTAIITEGLRWGYGVTERLQRISPDVALKYGDYTIPKGTPVGMSSVMMHDNPDIFPSPRSFQPDRWLQSNSAQLRKYNVAFGRGSRQCVGMQLAYCELYLIVAALFAPGRFKWELFETTERDIAIEHDFFNAFHSLDSKGVRVVVKEA